MSDKLTEKIIGAAIEVHKALGPGLLESIYEEALCHEFKLRNIKFERQLAIDFNYKGKILTGRRLDLLVGGEVVVELKSLQKTPDVAIAQIISYLKAMNLKRGLMINFGEKQLTQGIKRVSV